MKLDTIDGQVLLDRKVFRSFLAKLEPRPLTEDSTMFHVGQEAMKAELVDVLARSLGEEYSTSKLTMLMRQLNAG